MGGVNESVLESDKGKTQSILKPDPPVAMPPVGDTIQVDWGNVPPVAVQPFVQQQTIRQHVSGNSCHFHDDANSLKAAIPVADWWTALRQLSTMQPYTWVDAQNKTIAYFRPVLLNGVYDVTVEIVPVKFGTRFEQLTSLVRR